MYSFKWLISCRELVMPLLGSDKDMVLIYPSIIICLFESFLHCSLWLSIDNDVTGRWCLGLTIQSLAPGVGSRTSSFWYLLVWVERGMCASGVAKLSCIDNLGQSGYHNAHLVKYVCIHYMPELLIRFMESESFCSLLFCWYCLQWCNVAIVAVGLIYSVITPSSTNGLINAYILSFSRRFLVFLLVGFNFVRICSNLFKFGSILLPIRFSSIVLSCCCSNSRISPILFGSVQIGIKFDSDCP